MDKLYFAEMRLWIIDKIIRMKDEDLEKFYDQIPETYADDEDD